jgi:exosortase A-associated hydrolase 2
VTAATDARPVQPVSFAGPAGQLIALYHPPAPHREDLGDVIYVAPFAEEMNRSRRMAALQARALAASGMGVLLLDLYGTGDSGGDFADARWDIWLGDIAAAADWLVEHRRGAVALWGLRLGGLLAAHAAAKQPGRFRRLMLWQPASEGKAVLTQFLRLRVAAAMGASAGRETTDQLRAELISDRSLEIAGYEVAPALAAAIDAARIDRLAAGDVGAVDWLEVAAEADRPLTPAAQRAVAALRQGGVSITAASVVGQQFWTTQEITLAPELLAVTQRLLTTCPV